MQESILMSDREQLARIGMGDSIQCHERLVTLNDQRRTMELHQLMQNPETSKKIRYPPKQLNHGCRQADSAITSSHKEGAVHLHNRDR
jgi:hypothetical protein